LLIDNCASGGRRLELEMMRRSVALWRTDYNCFPHTKAEASQVHTAGLQLWLPLNSTSPMAQPGDTYQARSAYSTGVILSVKEFGLRTMDTPDVPWDWFRQRIDEARRLRPYFYGDYYPLTPIAFDSDGWLAYQLLLPDTQEGAVLAFRRPQSAQVSIAFQLRGLNLDATYEVEDADSGQRRTVTGLELSATGLGVVTDAPRTSRLFFYRTTTEFSQRAHQQPCK
jgi:alpha-galactosidase